MSLPPLVPVRLRGTPGVLGRPTLRRVLVFALTLLLLAPPAAAQTGGGPGPDRITPAEARTAVEAAVERSGIRATIRWIEERREASARLLARIGAIISPSGEEHERARAVAERMEAIGLDSVRVTESPNAIGVIPGRTGRAVVFVSTLDDLATVAEHQRRADGPPSVEGDRVVGPGTNTSLTTVAMLTAAEAYLRTGDRPERTLVFASVAREEAGLVGMRHLYDLYRERADVFVDILGDGHSISYGGLGIHWWRAVVHGPPGHTLRGGVPNVNQGIGRAVDRILSLPTAARTDPSRTRLNVSILRSGTVFNHKPDSGWFSLDIRSMDPDTLAAVEEEVTGLLADVERETGLEIEMVPHQKIPGGRIAGARDSEPVRIAEAISGWLGYEAELSETGSSNLNVAVAGGTPAIGLGGSRGGDRGQPTEWADVDALVRTGKHVFLLAVLLGAGDGTPPEE